jgi:ABC-type polysaccharide/polyol phosphate export permease
MIIQSPVDNAGILKSLAVSPYVFPDSALLSGLINFALTLIPFGILMIILGYRPDFLIVLLIPAMLLYSLFVYGLSLGLAALNVYFRDVSLLWNTLMPAVFYFTPVAYSPEMIPESSRYILKFNPFYHFTGLFRDILYYHTFPATQRWLLCLCMSIIVLIAGNFIYKRLQKGFISNF